MIFVIIFIQNFTTGGLFCTETHCCHLQKKKIIFTHTSRLYGGLHINVTIVLTDDRHILMHVMWQPPYKYRFLHYVEAYINENDVAAAI